MQVTEQELNGLMKYAEEKNLNVNRDLIPLLIGWMAEELSKQTPFKRAVGYVLDRARLQCEEQRKKYASIVGHYFATRPRRKKGKPRNATGRGYRRKNGQYLLDL